MQLYFIIEKDFNRKACCVMYVSFVYHHCRFQTLLAPGLWVMEVSNCLYSEAPNIIRLNISRLINTFILEAAQMFETPGL